MWWGWGWGGLVGGLVYGGARSRLQRVGTLGEESFGVGGEERRGYWTKEGGGCHHFLAESIIN